MADDEEAFRVFAAARLPALYRSALLLCGESHSAEDLAQEALTRVFLVWGSRRIDDPVAYTNKTLVRVFLSSRRKRSASERPIPDFPEGAVDSVDVGSRVDLQRALSALTALDRAIVVLRYIEDQPVDMVAAAVDLTTGNVRVRASRALQKLRNELEDQDAPYGLTTREVRVV